MRKKILVVLLAILDAALFVPGYSADFRRAENFEDCFSASCRVSVANARGTGTFIGYDNERERCVVLTNYHVVTTNDAARLDFWTNGKKESVNAQIFARFYNASAPYDFALLAVDPKELKLIDPPYIALAGRGASPDSNSFIVSAGAPKGRHIQAWKGQVLGYYQGATVEFRPAPVPGQSGSSIVSEIGGKLWVTGILTWLIGTEGSDESKGGAIPIANLYKALNKQTNTGSGFDPIPPGAVECSVSLPYVDEYTQDGCAPCVEAQEDVKAIKAAGYAVNTYNVSRAENKAQATARGVRKTPTFIVYDGRGLEIARYEGARTASEIIETLTKLEELETDKEEENEKTQEEKSTPPLDALTRSIPLIDSAALDFRKRPPVHEHNDYQKTDFFDDSDALWRNREGKAPAPSEKQNESEDVKKLFNNFGDSFYKKLTDDIDGRIAQLKAEAETLAEAKINEVKTSAIAYADSVKHRVMFLAFALFFAAAFTALCAFKLIDVIMKELREFLLYDFDEEEDEEETSENER